MESTPQLPKITLGEYLAKRGTCPALTRLEADIFGVPYPLMNGWPTRHGKLEITADMVAELRAAIGCASTSTTAKAKKALDSVMGVPSAPRTRKKAEPRVVAAFPDFALRSRGSPGLPWKV
jgi:hypothetical protein